MWTKEQIEKGVDHWGGCPECHNLDHRLNVHKEHWMVCHAHKKRWRVGWNLFSDWRYESEEVWRENAERIGDYEEVEPWHPRASVQVARREDGQNCAVCSCVFVVHERTLVVFLEGQIICRECAEKHADGLIQELVRRDRAARKQALDEPSFYTGHPKSTGHGRAAMAEVCRAV